MVFNSSDSRSTQLEKKNYLPYLGTVASEIVVGSKWEVDSLLAVWGGKSDTNNSPHIACCQPAFLIIVGAIQLPAFILEHNAVNYVNPFCSGFNSYNPFYLFFYLFYLQGNTRLSLKKHICKGQMFLALIFSNTNLKVLQRRISEL